MRYGPMLILLMLPAPAALADVTLAYGDAAQQPTYTLSIQGDRLRMETHDDAGSVVLFDAAKREMTVVDGGRREYLVVDEAAIARIQEQMKQALAMAAQFGLSPEKLGLGDVQERAEAVEVKTGETKTVAGFECELVRYEIDGVVDGTACVAEPGELGVAADDWRGMQSMFEMLMSMAADIVPVELGSMNLAPPEGIAVEARNADGSDAQVLKSVDDAPIDASMFEIPAGYKAIEIPSLGG